MMENISKLFSKTAYGAARAMGSPWAFIIATLSIIGWAATGPLFRYSDTWQLVVNTGTTVLTFLAVFLLQHSQNKDGDAIQLKLDELIRSSDAARNRLIDLEHREDHELEEIREEFSNLSKENLEHRMTAK